MQRVEILSCLSDEEMYGTELIPPGMVTVGPCAHNRMGAGDQRMVV